MANGPMVCSVELENAVYHDQELLLLLMLEQVYKTFGPDDEAAKVRCVQYFYERHARDGEGL